MEEEKIPTNKKSNFPELEDEEEEEYEDETFSQEFAKFCPYLQARSFLEKFFPKSEALKYLENYNFDDLKLKYPSLPSFHPKISSKSKSKKNSQKAKKIPLKCPFGFSSSSPFYSNIKKNPNNKCPFGFSSSFNNDEEKNINLNEINEEKEDSDSGDEIKKSGCPVMGKISSEPENKDFKSHYEVPLYGPYDFLFFLKGDLDSDQWLEKTKEIRNLPRYLKYTLFYQDKKELQEIHKLEFPKIFFIFDELKQKGIRYYNRLKYREALEYFNYAYGLMKWIEFKDIKRQNNFIKKPSMDAILDTDINIKQCYMDSPDGEEESYKSCVVYILLIMSYCFIGLRHYSCAIDCLNECEKEAGDLVPDVFIRRAQAFMCKKNATKEDLLKVKNDIEKGIKLGIKFNEDLKKEYDEFHPVYRTRYLNLDFYYKIKNKYDKIIEERLEKDTYSIRRVIGSICDNEHKNLKKEEALFIESLVLSKKEDIYRYYKVFKEMKKQYKQIIKFFSETNNPDIVDVTYDEYDKFMDSYEQFKFYYNFEFDNIDPKAIIRLNEQEKKLINDNNKYDFYLKRLMHLCENIYSHGYYNLEIFQYSLETVLEEESKENEEKEKNNNLVDNKNNSYDNFLMNISKNKFGIYLTIGFILLTLIGIGSQIL